MYLFMNSIYWIPTMWQALFWLPRLLQWAKSTQVPVLLNLTFSGGDRLIINIFFKVSSIVEAVGECSGKIEQDKRSGMPWGRGLTSYLGMCVCVFVCPMIQYSKAMNSELDPCTHFSNAVPKHWIPSPLRFCEPSVDLPPHLVYDT